MQDAKVHIKQHASLYVLHPQSRYYVDLPASRAKSSNIVLLPN